MALEKCNFFWTNIDSQNTNAKLGNEYVSGVTGGYGLFERDDRCHKLIVYAESHSMTIGSAWFKGSHMFNPRENMYTITRN